MRRCFVVANAIGRDATLNQLIPFLANHVNSRGELAAEKSQAAAVPTGSDEEDEILLILAEQLGQMVISGLVPGYRALSILPILEKLAGVEETVVRDKAVESMNSVIPLLIVDASVKGKEEEEARQTCVRSAPGLLLAMVKRMAGADWFTAKISACAVLPCVYQFFNSMKGSTLVSASDYDMGGGLEEGGGVTVDDIKLELRNMYRSLAEDDTPMVRRGAGKHVGRYAEAVAKLPFGKKGGNSGPVAKEFIIPGKDEAMITKTVIQECKNKVLEDVVPIYQVLANDEQDSVRLLAVSNSGSIGCALGIDGNLTSKVVLPIVKVHSADLSWRVRNHLAKDFAVVAQSQGFHEHYPNERIILFDSFAALLQDFEAEVRTSAVENIARMTQLGGVELFKSHLSPLLPGLADDPVMEVRSQLAQSMMDCCDASICTALPDNVILEDFKPLLEGFLKDEFSEVQIHILSKLSRVTHLLSQMDVVVQCILDMSKASNWRVREAVGFLLPHLAEARGVPFFQEKLFDMWMFLFMDQVSDVRSACVLGMAKLLTVTGAEWIQNQILPRYVELYSSANSYLTRITVLRSFSNFCKAEKCFTKELVVDVVDLLLKGMDDPVPNVRMIAACGLGDVIGIVEKGLLNSKIQPALQKCVTEDEDDDCKHFAQKAIESISG